MPSKIIINHSENYRERSGKIRYIIIHCSKFTPEKQIEILNEYKLSTHYIISQTGSITENCPPERVAYHSGESHWLQSEEKSLNETSIGIELEAPNLGQIKEDFTRKQYIALTHILEKLCNEYHIRPENILGHSDIAPARKIDPGCGFYWFKLYRKGYGTWPNMKQKHPSNNEEELLRIIGYNTENLVAARYAFCRHFFAEEVIYNSNLQELLDNPYPKDFTPHKQAEYMSRLKATAQAFQNARQKRYWYMEKKSKTD